MARESESSRLIQGSSYFLRNMQTLLFMVKFLLGLTFIIDI
jgi:hypothetical protein